VAPDVHAAAHNLVAHLAIKVDASAGMRGKRCWMVGEARKCRVHICSIVDFLEQSKKRPYKPMHRAL
jgi:hypothetical protein